MGVMRKSYRIIHGQRYHIVGSAKPVRKSVAIREAKEIRRKDFPTVIIKAKDGYRVFARYSYYRRKRRRK